MKKSKINDVIRRNLLYLLDNVTITERFYASLFQHNVFPRDVMYIIRSQQSQDGQIAMMLQQLIKRPVEAFDNFLKVLRKTQQGFIADHLEGDYNAGWISSTADSGSTNVEPSRQHSNSIEVERLEMKLKTLQNECNVVKEENQRLKLTAEGKRALMVDLEKQIGNKDAQIQQLLVKRRLMTKKLHLDDTASDQEIIDTINGLRVMLDKSYERANQLEATLCSMKTQNLELEHAKWDLEMRCDEFSEQLRRIQIEIDSFLHLPSRTSEMTAGTAVQTSVTAKNTDTRKAFLDGPPMRFPPIQNQRVRFDAQSQVHLRGERLTRTSTAHSNGVFQQKSSVRPNGQV